MKANCSIALLVGLLLTANASAEMPSITQELKPQEFYRQASAAPPKKITAKQLAKRLENKAVILIDLRAKEAFAAGHIRGAINVPVELLTLEHLQTIVPDSDFPIVVYCANNFMPTRMIALTTLGYPAIEQLGYRNVRRLEDLWYSPSCQKSEKLAGLDQSDRGYDAQCESLLPMERSER